MSILFTSAIDFDSSAYLGISSKVMSQAKAAEEAGHDVFISKDHGAETRIVRPISGEIIAQYFWPSAHGRRAKYVFLRKWALENNIEAAVARFDLLDGVFCRFSRGLRTAGVVVAVEFPTFPLDKERYARHKKLLEAHKYVKYFVRRSYARLEKWRSMHATSYIDYTISYLDDKDIWGVPNITYDNGVDLSSVAKREVRAPDGSIRLLAVAKFSSRHGIDRLIRGLSEYGGGRNVQLVLVGEGEEIPHLEELVRLYDLKASVVFAGAASGADLDAFFDEADIAVGSLGLHRVGIALGSTMKSREYCARGIPFIYSFPEKGFTGEEPFALMLPSDDEPVDIESVIAFADKMISAPNIASEMRVFAEAHFDWKVQMDKVLTVLEAAVDDRRNGHDE